ncbi:MAG: glycosyl transferase [Elusimicrobia bacterium]|nr:glycosyl transferase [Elusimicrobiota bacterium]
MSRREQEIVALVDMVFAPTDVLIRRFKAHVPRVALVPNACDPGDLPRVEDLPRAETRRGFGYTGTMARWFDWSLVKTLAESFPSDPVELIGPIYHRPKGRLPQNVRLRPPLSSTQAMEAASHFAVGIIPFVMDELTNAVDPIKYYEYVALGLPVLATPFGGMGAHRGKPGVFLAKGPAEWARQAQVAMKFKMAQDPASFRKENSWEARFDGSGLLSPL